MDDKPLFTSEADFRSWFEMNLDHFGVASVVLSQEPCPDYVLKMKDGQFAKVEAELFAINFRYHRHDPRKVDFILACYSKTRHVDGVPVVALHELNVWEPDDAPAQTETASPLGELERGLLDTLLRTGGVAVAALSDGPLAGNHTLWIRFAPEKVGSLPRGSDDSVFTVMPPEAKRFIKKYHHALVGAGLSAEACDAL